MNQGKDNKKKSPLVSIIIGVLFVLFFAMDDAADVVFGIIGLLVFVMVIVGILAAVVYGIKKKKPQAEGHSHDRIDHSRDLKINPATGKAEGAPVRTATAHSPREHWKQQLDGLLANGTIDRAEYKALMKRRF